MCEGTYMGRNLSVKAPMYEGIYVRKKLCANLCGKAPMCEETCVVPMWMLPMWEGTFV